jgi:hypothetical protein
VLESGSGYAMKRYGSRLYIWFASLIILLSGQKTPKDNLESSDGSYHLTIVSRT